VQTLPIWYVVPSPAFTITHGCVVEPQRFLFGAGCPQIWCGSSMVAQKKPPGQSVSMWQSFIVQYAFASPEPAVAHTSGWQADCAQPGTVQAVIPSGQRPMEQVPFVAQSGSGVQVPPPHCV
jgi:hypothetical protein